MKHDGADIDQLKSIAVEAARNSYCPYSGFRVGAAVEVSVRGSALG